MDRRRPIVDMVRGEAQLLQLLPAQAISSLLRGVNVHLEQGKGQEQQEPGYVEEVA